MQKKIKTLINGMKENQLSFYEVTVYDYRNKPKSIEEIFNRNNDIEQEGHQLLVNAKKIGLHNINSNVMTSLLSSMMNRPLDEHQQSQYGIETIHLGIMNEVRIPELKKLVKIVIKYFQKTNRIEIGMIDSEIGNHI